MIKIQLQLFQKIIGIGSASGILYHKNSLFIISDNSLFLYQYNLETDLLIKHRLDENPNENIPKINKPDFESMALDGNEILILGSGSTQNRNTAKRFHLESKHYRTVDFTNQFENFKRIATLTDNDLNIEGLIITSEKSYFFQRGNSINASNGIFIMTQSINEVTFKAINLPKLNDIEASFTDAILVNENIYFLAAVENTISRYDDGEVLGTFIGKMNSKTFEIDFTELISENHKFEGLTFYKVLENEITFLLCEDNDTEELESNVYKLILSK